MILLTGFGPFLDVKHNPSGALVSECHGLRICGETLIGTVLPVSYRRAIAETVHMGQSLEPRLILGTGLTRKATTPRLERYAYSEYSDSLCDMDGEIGTPPQGPSKVTATVNAIRLSEALQVPLSTEPGRYVCNAWLYEVSLSLPHIAVGFLHVPSTGFEVSRLLDGLKTYLGGASAS